MMHTFTIDDETTLSHGMKHCGEVNMHHAHIHVSGLTIDDETWKIPLRPLLYTYHRTGDIAAKLVSTPAGGHFGEYYNKTVINFKAGMLALIAVC
jgi:hypothetical protein